MFYITYAPPSCLHSRFYIHLCNSAVLPFSGSGKSAPPFVGSRLKDSWMRRKTKNTTRKTYPQLHSDAGKWNGRQSIFCRFWWYMQRKSHRYNKARFGRNFYELLWRHLWFAQKYLAMLIDFYTVDVHNKIMIQSFKNRVAGFNSSTLW